MGSHSVSVMEVSGVDVGGCGWGVAGVVEGVAVGAIGVGVAGALVQAANATSRTSTDPLANRRKSWNMLAVDGVMVMSVPIIAQPIQG